jgi:hypothetical protein
MRVSVQIHSSVTLLRLLMPRNMAAEGVEYSRENNLFHPKEQELVKLGRQVNQSELQKVLLSAVIRMRAHQALKVNQ